MIVRDPHMDPLTHPASVSLVALAKDSKETK